jgi:hypothetical protein
MHTGEALGATGRFAWFLAGLSLFVLLCQWFAALVIPERQGS